MLIAPKYDRNTVTAHEDVMSAITLDQANRIIVAILKRGAEINCRPLSVLVVEPGCKVKAFQKEDGSSMIRFEMAYGKAYAALAMGYGANWITDWYSYDPEALAVIGLAGAERVAGCLLMGTPREPPRERERPDVRALVTNWGAGAEKP